MTRRPQISPDALHQKLVDLWFTYTGMGFKTGSVKLDPDTWALILGSKEAREEGSVGYAPDAPNMFREMPVFTKRGLLAAEGTPGHCSLIDAELVYEPFCMYIEAIKENGRRVYFDDPDTDEVFL